VTTPGPAAALEEIRGRGYRNGATGAECARLSDAAADDVPRLVAALEAVLKLADKWEQEGRRLAALAAEETDPQSRIAVSLRAQAFEDCAKVRDAVTRELTGEGGSDER
jgi:hypothetical protein